MNSYDSNMADALGNKDTTLKQGDRVLIGSQLSSKKLSGKRTVNEILRGISTTYQLVMQTDPMCCELKEVARTNRYEK